MMSQANGAPIPIRNDKNEKVPGFFKHNFNVFVDFSGNLRSNNGVCTKRFYKLVGAL